MTLLLGRTHLNLPSILFKASSFKLQDPGSLLDRMDNHYLWLCAVPRHVLITPHPSPATCRQRVPPQLLSIAPRDFVQTRYNWYESPCFKASSLPLTIPKYPNSLPSESSLNCNTNTNPNRNPFQVAICSPSSCLPSHRQPSTTVDRCHRFRCLMGRRGRTTRASS